MYKLFLALRYLRANRIIYFSIAGVAVGVMVLVIVNSVMGGFSRDMRQRIRGMQADLTLTTISPDIYLPEYEDLLAEVSRLEHVRGAAPRLEHVASLGVKGSGRTVHLMGIVPERERGTSEIGDYFQRGGKREFDFRTEGGGKPRYPGVVPGIALPAGPVVQMLSYRHSPPGILGGDRKYEVVGFFQSGMSEYDSTLIFLSLESMQEFMQDKTANQIAIDLDDYDRNLEGVRTAVIECVHRQRPCRTPSDHSWGRCGKYVTKSWEQAKAVLLQAVAIEKGIMAIILFFIVIVAGFNIIAIYTLMVRAKTRDIGILRALGASEGGITTIFLLSGTVCGLVGCAVGILAGLFFSYNLNAITDFVERQSVELNLSSRPRWAAGEESARAASLVRWVPLLWGAGLAGVTLLWMRRRRWFAALALLPASLGLLGTGIAGVAGGLTGRPLEWLTFSLLFASFALQLVLWVRFYARGIGADWLWSGALAVTLATASWFSFVWMRREGGADLLGTHRWIVGASLLFPFAMILLQRWSARITEGALKFLVHSLSTAIWFGSVLLVVGALSLTISVVAMDPSPNWSGINLFPRDIYYLDRIPVYVDTKSITMLVGLTLVVSLIFSIYPARRAASLDPIEAIREE